MQTKTNANKSRHQKVIAGGFSPKSLVIFDAAIPNAAAPFLQPDSFGSTDYSLLQDA
jgi:hypothetical protein